MIMQLPYDFAVLRPPSHHRSRESARRATAADTFHARRAAAAGRRGGAWRGLPPWRRARRVLEGAALHAKPVSTRALQTTGCGSPRRTQVGVPGGTGDLNGSVSVARARVCVGGGQPASEHVCVCARRALLATTPAPSTGHRICSIAKVSYNLVNLLLVCQTGKCMILSC